MRQRVIYIMFLCLSAFFVNAQSQPDVDSLYHQARLAAHSGKLAEARQQLRAILKVNPNQGDALILMSQTYGWENQFDSARIVLGRIPNQNEEWLLAAANTETWDAKYGRALVYTERGLQQNPRDESFLYLKTHLQILMGNYGDAQQTFATLRSVNPKNEHLEQLSRELIKPIKLDDADSLYLAARDKFRKEDKPQDARRMARNLLTQYPNYDDANLLIGQTYAAESNYDSARLMYRPLLEKQPNNYDLLWQMAVYEEIDKKYATAVQYLDQALQAYPKNETLLYQKVWIQYEADDTENALKTIDTLLDIDPEHAKGKEVKKLILSNRYKDYVFLENYFENTSPDAHLITSAGLFKGFKRASYIAKLNLGETLPLQSPAYQFEAETYQKLFPTNYLYADYAFSASDFYFPRHRAALEFFQVIGKPVEASLGGRMIYWESDRVQWLITGSVSYTHLDNYFCLRAFVGLSSQESFVLTYRRMFGEKREQYFYATAVIGSYNDELVQFNTLRENAYVGIAGIQKFLGNRWFLHVNAGYTHDEYGGRLLATLGFRYYFNIFNKK